MSDDDSTPNAISFDAEMRQLAGADMDQLAQEALAKNRAKAKMATDRSELTLTLGQIILPLAREIELVKQSAVENNLLLSALSKIVNGQHAVNFTQSSALDGLAQQMQRLGSVESANQKLFDALHTELKGYKDNFLFDVLQKPFIRELLPVFDDLASMRDQLEKRLEPPQAEVAPGLEASPKEEPAGGDREFLKNLAGNVENHVHHLTEVLSRMNVLLTHTTPGLPVDKKAHRTISFEAATTSEQDNTVARSLKPGFSWNDRMIRPEDIVAFRWRPPADPSQTPAAFERPVVTTPSI